MLLPTSPIQSFSFRNTSLPYFQLWKVTSHKDCRKNLPSSQNCLIFWGKHFPFFQPNFSNSHEHTERRKLTNFGHGTKLVAAALNDSCSRQGTKLIAAALNDASSRRDNDKVFLPNPGKDSSIDAERLDITLEFQKAKDDAMDELPSVLNLSISDSDPCPSLNKATEDHHLRKSCDVNLAKNRFRDATRTCNEDAMGWASSVFPTNHIRSRSMSKLPTTGKHRLVLSDSVRPSKSKIRRSSVEHCEMCNFISEQVLLPFPMAAPMNPNPRFDLNTPVNEDVGIYDLERNSYSYIDGSLLEMDNFGVLPHECVPGLIGGLDDEQLPEYMDIG